MILLKRRVIFRANLLTIVARARVIFPAFLAPLLAFGDNKKFKIHFNTVLYFNTLFSIQEFKCIFLVVKEDVFSLDLP